MSLVQKFENGPFFWAEAGSQAGHNWASTMFPGRLPLCVAQDTQQIWQLWTPLPAAVNVMIDYMGMPTKTSSPHMKSCFTKYDLVRL
jgi:hypothetical protein